jgi:ATP-dependent DNA ligase
LREAFDERVILDGELYVHGWPLQRINAAVTPVRQEASEDTKLVEYHVFDVVDFGKSFEDRYGSVVDLLVKLNLKEVRAVGMRRVLRSTQDLSYAEFVRDGYEGMMYRLGDCPYTQPKDAVPEPRLGTNRRTRFLSDKDNRCWHLLKRKDWQDDEFECMGVEEGEGRLKGTLGALTCAIDEGQAAGFSKLTFSVGSGLTDAERNHYWANPPIGHLIKVKYLVLSNDGIPLNPTILAIL